MSSDSNAVLITCVGATPIVVVNVYAHYLMHDELRRLRIKYVLLGASSNTIRFIDSIGRCLREVATYFGREVPEVDYVEVDPFDIYDIWSKLRKRVVERYGDLVRVVDVTAGTKPMSIALYKLATDIDAKYVTYLSLRSREFENLPFTDIPKYYSNIVILERKV
ncbi:MAG: hypothetical protein DRJ40_09665 [Thermoprotei archaeon]|nr:MAG: hypothetical protein DRJ40_09665 [Thermoprotei archaeon]